MEQQTISIAKAGITTILNSRANVLTAANPVVGRYDEMRSASENIDLMSTIISRFDMIFIVRDIQDDARDRQIAAHVKFITYFGETTIPVTVRQLEALVRIAGSLAKMHLLNEPTREHVQETIRLFSVSTMNAANAETRSYCGVWLTFRVT
ncbi:hypothetical protein F442_22444 [Phytophthora nicotianae P10297]|uniref:MCM C-terminal AAA(+) ATPase domain-containing protein n=1 Tax=Phytophthora nicotianae P10297 TaxID=1317064 RepID=W2Y0W5_PHYNI|nr:hypothetical protein F442_22444 [Phytophthora nicotianae P10297]